MSTDRSPLALAPVSGRRRGRVAFAAWLAALLAVVAWVAAAGIGSAPPGRIPVAAPGIGASAPASLRPSPSGPMQRLAEPPPSGTVWLRSGNGARSLDLSSGEVGQVVGTDDWRDAIFRLPDGRFVCVCSDVTATDGGEQVTVSLANIDGGMVAASSELVTIEGVRDERVEVPGQPDSPPLAVAISASLSPDGSLIAVGISVRRPPQWERSVVLVDVGARKLVQRVELAPAPAEQGIEGWAPRIQFDADSRQALVSITAWQSNSTIDERYFVARINGGRLALEPAPGFGTRNELADGQCVGSWLVHLNGDRLFGLCARDGGTPTLFRSVALGTGKIVDLPLGPVLKGVYPMQLVDRARGILYLWDPFSHRAARIHIASAKLDSSTVIDTPTAALTPLEHLARSVSAWIAPAALAKIMLEPGLALSADGRRLYVVAMSGDGFTEPGRASTVHVLDAATLRVRATWNLEPDVVSIAMAPNGRDVVVGTLATAPEGVAPDAAVAVLDGATGQPRARYEGFDSEWPMLVDPSALNQ
jgi:hypothetical protein